MSPTPTVNCTKRNLKLEELYLEVFKNRFFKKALLPMLRRSLKQAELFSGSQNSFDLEIGRKESFKDRTGTEGKGRFGSQVVRGFLIYWIETITTCLSGKDLAAM